MDECKRIYCRLNGVRIMKSSNEQINCLLEGGVFENGVCRISGESIKRREQIEEKISHMDDVDFSQLCFLVGDSTYKRVIAIRERMGESRNEYSDSKLGMGKKLS